MTDLLIYVKNVLGADNKRLVYCRYNEPHSFNLDKRHFLMLANDIKSVILMYRCDSLKTMVASFLE